MLPLFGLAADVEVAAAIGMVFTVISIVRSSVLLRVFEAIRRKA